MPDENQLWEHKYKPHCLDEIIGHKDITHRFKQYVKKRFIPNMTLGGSPGVSKTLLAECFAHDMGMIDWNEKNEIEIQVPGQYQFFNASDSRGIEMVRKELKDKAEKPILNNEPRLIILDEGDNITPDAQAAMRGLIENCSNNARFILTGNYPEEFLEAINSRCPLLVVPPLTKEDITIMIKRIQDKEKFTITQDAMDALFTVSKGDMRLMIKRLQDAHIVSDGNIQKQHITTQDIDLEQAKIILETAIKNYAHARELMMVIYNTSKDSSKILGKLYDAVELVQFSQKIPDNEILQRKIRDKIAETDYRIQQGTNIIIQLDSILNFVRLLQFVPLNCGGK